MHVDVKTILQPEEKNYFVQVWLHFQTGEKNRYFYKLMLRLSYVDATKLLLPECSFLVLVIMYVQFQTPSYKQNAPPTSMQKKTPTTPAV